MMAAMFPYFIDTLKTALPHKEANKISKIAPPQFQNVHKKCDLEKVFFVQDPFYLTHFHLYSAYV